MPGLFVWGPPSADRDEEVLPRPLTASLTYYNGDPVVQIAAGTVRPLTTTDVSNSYVNTSIAGVFGLYTGQCATTDANGFLGAPLPPTGISGEAYVRQSYGIDDFFSHDMNVGLESSANISTMANLIGGQLWEVTAITELLVGTPVGLYYSTISGIVYWFWSSAAVVKIGTIAEVRKVDAMYDIAGTTIVQNVAPFYPRCPIGVRILPAYQQALLAITYA